jgi:pilus assembly protein Flp/PilA
MPGHEVIFRMLHSFAADERGVTAVEYGLIAALLSVAIIGVVFSVGENLRTVLYGKIATALQSM